MILLLQNKEDCFVAGDVCIGGLAREAGAHVLLVFHTKKTKEGQGKAGSLYSYTSRDPACTHG